MPASVQVAFCVDTEGPCADPSRPELLAIWDAVDAAMGKLFDPAFRRRFPDPAGGQLTIGWFFLTWTGFRTNPRGRAMGYHQIRDHYLARWGERLEAFGDEQCWHYHHPSPSGVGNEWGIDWTVCPEYEQIISRQILEREWFAACYRAGGTIMDLLSSRWVDAWFPFDYSNRAPLKIAGLVDWSAGVKDWSVYHPAPEDFRVPGAGRRKMARCLDLQTTVYALQDDEIAAAFERAAAGRPAVLSCFDHDYRDIAARVDGFRERVSRVAGRFPSVRWQYAGPVRAIQRYLEAPAGPPLRLEAACRNGLVSVWSTAPLFQSMPWLAVLTRDGRVHHIESEVIRVDATHWQWTPSNDLEWAEAGFAGSTDLGQTAVVRIQPDGRSPGGFLDPPMEAHPLRPRSIWEHSRLFLESCIARASGAAPEMDSIAQAAELLRPRLQPGMTLLDVGCAAGHAWRSFKHLGVEYFGIDPYGRGIEIGRLHLGETGLAADRLRALALEELPGGERYDAVVCLNTLYTFPAYQQPLEILARAAERWLLIRSSFGDATEIRYLPDILLERGFQGMRGYFTIFSRTEVQRFLEAEGFAVTWLTDRRQHEKFGGKPEVVGGIDLPYEFLLAERVRPAPGEDAIQGEQFRSAARAWRDRKSGGPAR